VELVHEPFLWLPDLTEPDPFYILPLAAGAAMFLQNRMMPTTGDETQAKMLRWMMPIMIGGFIMFMPSGLGLYMLVSTLLGVIQTAIQVGVKSSTPQTTK
jgi:YidC/Oxa1 family membrane protein insertase